MLLSFADEVMTCWDTTFQIRRSLWSWCGSLPFRRRCTLSSWSASERQGTAAGSALTLSKLSASAARSDCFVPVWELSPCFIHWPSLNLSLLHACRSGITLTSSMKPYRRRTRPTSRTWTWMTSPQPVTLAALLPVQVWRPKWQTRATAKATTACHRSIRLKIEPIKSSRMNG